MVYKVKTLVPSMNMKQSLLILVYPSGKPSGYTRIQRLCFIFIEGTRVFTLYTMNFAGRYRRRQISYLPLATCLWPGGIQGLDFSVQL